MKQLLKKSFPFILLFLGEICIGQTNLVINPSFELYDTCPVNQNHVSYAFGWHNSGGSPDYFNSCSLNWEFFVPTNWGGYQQPASGNAYAAFATYSYSANYPNLRENIGGTLSSPLTLGTKYFVSFKVSLSLFDTIQTSCATNNLGAMFSSVPYNWYNHAPLTNNPQIHTNTIITDTADWTMIFGSFIADSNYQYIIVGNFYNDSNTDTLLLDSSSINNCFAYYFLDNVCVSTDSLYSFNYIYTGIMETSNKGNVSVYPNPSSDFINIDIPFQNEPYNCVIYDIFGREVFFKQKVINPLEHIPISDIEGNILFLKIIYKNEIYNYKLIKQ